MAKNVGAEERWVCVTGGGILILLGLWLAGWGGWVSGLVGCALVLTSVLRY